DRNRVLAGEIDEGRIAKACMFRLDHVPQGMAVRASRQLLEKGGDILRLEFLAGVELPKYRPELLSQFRNPAGEEALDRRACPCKHAALGGGARRLDRKDEIIRRFACPFSKARPRLGTVEGAVDLNRGHLAAGIFELARLRQARRIELAAPWLEPPTT